MEYEGKQVLVTPEPYALNRFGVDFGKCASSEHHFLRSRLVEAVKKAVELADRKEYDAARYIIRGYSLDLQNIPELADMKQDVEGEIMLAVSTPANYEK